MNEDLFLENIFVFICALFSVYNIYIINYNYVQYTPIFLSVPNIYVIDHFIRIQHEVNYFANAL